LGLLKQTYHVRQDEDFGKAADRQSSAFEEKESYRWYEHFKQGQVLSEQNAALEMVYIADREADIMELFLARNCERMHFIIRSQHNRKLEDKSGNLRATIRAKDSQGTYKIKAYEPNTLKERQAEIEVRFCKMNLKLHKELPRKKHLGGAELYVVEAWEHQPPDHIKEPIHWILLTTLSVETLTDALQIIAYYTKRWLIERFHFLLKSGGSNVENLQLQTKHRLQNALATYSVACFKVFKIRYIADYQPDAPIYKVGISPIEYKVLYEYAHQKISNTIVYDPSKQPTMSEYCVVLGRIAGFLPSKRQPIPGLKILTRAVDLLQNLVDAYLLFCQRTE
jgi:Transposase DDE domain